MTFYYFLFFIESIVLPTTDYIICNTTNTNFIITNYFVVSNYIKKKKL